MRGPRLEDISSWRRVFCASQPGSRPAPGTHRPPPRMAEGEELGSNLLRVVRSSRGYSGGSGAPRRDGRKRRWFLRPLSGPAPLGQTEGSQGHAAGSAEAGPLLVARRTPKGHRLPSAAAGAALNAAIAIAMRNIPLFKAASKGSRARRAAAGDAELTSDIPRLVDRRPTYGYRRLAAPL